MSETTTWDFESRTYHVPCPHCDRAEDLDDRLTGYAWLTGHIHEEHADELPAFAGTGGEDR